jgi:oligopeptide/dipeptide ABC transporter ATP-binding protein
MNARLSCRNLVVEYPTAHGKLRAVRGASFDIAAGQTVALVGESGSGKSSVGRAIVRLLKPVSGSIILDGTDIAQLSERQLRPFRLSMQMIFQDPFGSLNPRQRVRGLVVAPLDVNRIGTPAERQKRADELLARVGIEPSGGDRLPHEFSGGQRQRIAIARALSLNPGLIVCDEAVSALDVSVQAQVMNLLVDLQRERGMSYLFISHDLAAVRQIAHEVVVMYLGQVMARAPHRSFWSQPLHPYARRLLAATPTMGSFRDEQPPPASAAGDEIPSASNPPSGCAYRTRCEFVVDACAVTPPVLREIRPGEFTACHRVSLDSLGRVTVPWESSPRQEAHEPQENEGPASPQSLAAT